MYKFSSKIYASIVEVTPLWALTNKYRKSFRKSKSSFITFLERNKIVYWRIQKYKFHPDERIFISIKKCLFQASILSYPVYPGHLWYKRILRYSSGARLFQNYPEGNKIIFYLSRSLTRIKCLAVSSYLERSTIVTNNYSLLWVHVLKDWTGRWTVHLN